MGRLDPSPIYAVVAFLLAWATFAIGIFLLSIPAPVSWLRAAGFELVTDSYAAMFLFTVVVAIYAGGGALVAAVFPPFCHTVQCTPGWESVAAWLSKEKFDTIAVMTELAVPKNLLDAISSLSPVNIEPLISQSKTVYEMATAPINNMLMSYALALVGLDYLVSFLQAYWWQLIFLGAVFWAIPGRIGRIVGAWMIAFSVVFYFGLPGLRFFMRWFTGYESMLVAFNATALSNLAASVTSPTMNPIDFGIRLATRLLQIGNDFAGYMTLRLIALALYNIILASISAGVAQAIGHSGPPVEVEETGPGG